MARARPLEEAGALLGRLESASSRVLLHLRRVETLRAEPLASSPSVDCVCGCGCGRVRGLLAHASLGLGVIEMGGVYIYIYKYIYRVICPRTFLGGTMAMASFGGMEMWWGRVSFSLLTLLRN